MSARQGLGRYGEEVAARYLVEIGMSVVDRNWRCPTGELDVVALDGDILVFCEVKTRVSDKYGGPLAAVTPKKLARLRRLAGQWVAIHPISPSGMRIDVVGVMAPPRGRAEIVHLQGVG